MLKNVIIVCDYGTIEGGAARIAHETAISLKEEGLNVIFFCAVSPVSEELQDAGVQIVCLNQKDILHDGKIKGALRGISNKAAKREFSKLLDTLDPKETVIHVHTWTKGVSSSIFKVSEKKKFQTVITVHDYFLICPNGGLFNYPKKQICTLKPMSFSCVKCNCDARSYSQKLFRVVRQKRQNRNIRRRKNISYIFISDFSKREFFKRYDKIPQEKQYFLPNMVHYGKDRKRVACENNDTFLFIGGLTEVKGIRTFCEAVTKTNVKAVVIGQGILGKELQEKYPNIEFVGWKNKAEMAEYLEKTRCLIFPSVWYEAAPLTPLEVMTCGVPVICCEDNAGSDYIQEGENGWLYQGNDANALASVILEKSTSENIFKASKGAFEGFQEETFSKTAHVKRLMEIYNEVITTETFHGDLR